MSVKQYVAYIVGSILSFPVYIYHLLPNDKEEGSRDEKKSAQPQKDKKFLTSKTKAKNLSNVSKKTCGHSQKNVRLDHKKH